MCELVQWVVLSNLWPERSGFYFCCCLKPQILSNDMLVILVSFDSKLPTGICCQPGRLFAASTNFTTVLFRPIECRICWSCMPRHISRPIDRVENASISQSLKKQRVRAKQRAIITAGCRLASIRHTTLAQPSKNHVAGISRSQTSGAEGLQRNALSPQGRRTREKSNRQEYCLLTSVSLKTFSSWFHYVICFASDFTVRFCSFQFFFVFLFSFFSGEMKK